MKHVSLNQGDITFGNDLPFVLIAGPCVLESLDHALKMASALQKMAEKMKIPFVYKTSFDKANRSSHNSARGVGLEKALGIFARLKAELGCPIVTDVHTPEQCAEAACIVDMLQIPAFLCRQTDMLKAAAETGKVINIKKGQFLAPWDMANVVGKMESFGCTQFLLCERGASFGYNMLVSDMRSLPVMAKTGYPVVYDATHSVQQPTGAGGTTSGDRTFVPPLARAAVAVGVASVFIETHQDPDNAPSDGPNMVKLEDMEALLTDLKRFDQIRKEELLVV